MIEKSVREMVDMVGSVSYSFDEGPECLVYLHMIAETDFGWQDVIEALISSVPFRKPLATAAIVIIFDECPLPPVYIVLETLYAFGLGRKLALSSYSNGELRRRERNRLVVLGCMADKFAASISSKMMGPHTMKYLYTFLMDYRSPILVLHAMITLEKFSRSIECKTALVAFFEKQEMQNPLIPLERYYDSSNVLWMQIGFCARWLLDNIFLVQERALSYTTMDMSETNAILEIRDTTDFLKISSDGLQARCDAPTFEYVRCTFQVVTGCWYYEVEILTPGVMQIGWAAKETKFTTHAGYGIKDDHFTLAYDGCRRTLWHKTEPRLVEDVEPWCPGDILGCFIDVGKQEAIFALNGVRLPVCKEIFKRNRESFGERPNRTKGFYAAASLMCFQGLRFNFGLREFRFAPVDRDFMTFNSQGTLTTEQKQILPNWLYIERMKALEVDKDEDIENLCTICYDRKTETSASPCHHMSFCYECAARLTKCPVCRNPIWMTNKKTL